MNNLPELHLAVKNMDLVVVRKLVENGIDVNARDSQNKTPLHYFNYKYDPEVQHEMLYFFLHHGASVTSREKGDTVAANIFRYGKANLVKILINFGIDLSATENDGSTLLHHAAFNKNPGVIDLFQNKCVDVNALDNSDKTPLSCAVQNLNLNAITFLLENGAIYISEKAVSCIFIIVNFTEKNSENYLPFIELFLAHGADCEAAISDNIYRHTTILDQAIALDYFEILEPVLADLAKKEALDKPFKENTIWKINSHKKSKDYYTFCKRNIEEMKGIVIHNFTLYDFLKKTDQQILQLVQNQEIAEKLKKSFSSEWLSKCYVIKHLQSRINRIFNEIKLRKQCTVDMAKCTILGRNGDVIEMIVKYLSENDLKNLCKAIKDQPLYSDDHQSPRLSIL